jgi:flagellar basal-body rod protein FlgF
MAYGIYLSAEGALAQMTRMETIANNLANVDTAGFKRDLALVAARLAEETHRGWDPAGSGSINNVGGGTEVLATATDFSMGPLKQTGLPTDVALRGDGFFLIRRDGQTYLTRAGNFVLTDEGMLVTQDHGDPVLAESGDPVQIVGPWQMTDDGTIEQPDGITRLAIAEPDHLNELQKVGQNLYLPSGRIHPLEDTRRRIAQGFLELSGVKPTLEMMDMITTSRLFEANVTLIRSQDQLLSTLLGRVLRV